MIQLKRLDKLKQKEETMATKISTKNKKLFIFQLLAVGGSAAFFGVMLTIGLGLGKYWLDLEPLVFAQWFKDYYSLLLPWAMLVLSPALIGVIGALVMRKSHRVEYKWWKIALISLSVAFLITLVYHLPANVRIWSLEQSSTEVATELNSWLIMHVLRVVASLVAAYATFRAIFEMAIRTKK